MARQENRIDLEAGFVLHSYPYRETSLILDVFTRNHGRLSMVARGARRPTSVLRGVVQPFQPLLISWYGKHELRTLHKLEWVGGHPAHAEDGLVCAYYLNELLIRFLPKEDASSQALYDLYADTLRQLAHRAPVLPLLRQFELNLLTELGYGLSLSTTIHGAMVEAHHRYVYRHMVGVLEEDQYDAETDVLISGHTLQALAAGKLEDRTAKREARLLLREVLQQLLPENASLASRELMRRIHEIQQRPLESPSFVDD